jgi:exodeoxyribonuclease III
MNSKKILLVGAKGVVGRWVHQALKADHTVITAGLEAPLGADDLQLDLTDTAAVQHALLRLGPLDAVVSTAGRAHFRALQGLGLHDAFRLFEQPAKSWSWWDYRNLAFRKNQGLRIDHILVSQALKAQVSACTIDKAPRRNERPSDHAPVVLTLDMPAR